MGHEKQSNSEDDNYSVICSKCKEKQSEKYGIYYCTTLGCEGQFMLPSTRKIALETLVRIRAKHKEYSQSEDKLPQRLNDPYYESFLNAYSNFNAIASFVEQDLNSMAHSTDSRIAMCYLEFFQAAERFEKMLDDWESSKGIQI